MTNTRIIDAKTQGCKNAKEDLTLENELRKAITNNELRVFYQPIIDPENQKIVNLETLVRWQHPLRGLLMPSEFIPIAEETGLILQLGDWVLQEACTQMKNWHKEFLAT